MIQPITLDGSNVSAEMDACIHQALFGFDGVLKFGNNFGYVIESNNLIKIKDGLLLSQGRFLRVKVGTTESVRIESGHAGSNRKDLIVVHFETNGITETYDIRVKKGVDNGSVPTPVKGDTFNGAMVNELPLYVVNLNGINIQSVVPQFTVYDSLFKMANRIKYGHGAPSDLKPEEIYLELE